MSTVHEKVTELEKQLGALKKRDLRFVFTREIDGQKHWMTREASIWTDDVNHPRLARIRSEKTALKRLKQMVTRGKMDVVIANAITIEVMDIEV